MLEAKSIGIDALGVAFPAHYLRLEELAAARRVDPAKYTKGLGGVAMAVAHPAEDTVTLAATAARAALEQGNIDPADVGLVIVGTETAVDHAKPVASYVQGLLGLPHTCRVYEIKHACYGATAGVLAAAEWLASGAAKGKRALVVASDIARYGLGTPGEPTQGAGAAAMLISAQPRLVELDYLNTGRWSKDVHDFWRPLASPDALVDGAFSLHCYLEAVVQAYLHHAGDNLTLEREYGALLFHTPFVKMAEKGHAALLQSTRGANLEETARSFADRTAPSLAVAAQIGNAYSASLWICLAAALHSGRYPKGTRVGLFSYGSGFCAEFFTGRVVGDRIEIPSLRALDARRPIDVATYERWFMARVGRCEAEPVTLPGPFVYLGERDAKRVYTANAAVTT